MSRPFVWLGVTLMLMLIGSDVHAQNARAAVRRITVEPNVTLEVLDWGGTGRPVVLLAGLGNDAHVYDKFAPKLATDYHVYGITRRGFGASSSPALGYTADRLGDDVLAVLDSLALVRPVLVGHSVAGEELSSVGSRRPERIAGLVYLEAGHAYAYYDSTRGNFAIDLADMQRKLDQLWPGAGLGTRDLGDLLQQLIATDLPRMERDLRDVQKAVASAPVQPSRPIKPGPVSPSELIMMGGQKYRNIPAPSLAIYAFPRQLPPVQLDAAQRAALLAADSAIAAQANAFERGVPTARVVRLPNATHAVFLSNEADVLREMRAFIGALPPM
ncbi:MAG: alpha/beta hydrolase [Gemmatimonas sp.]